MPLLLCATLRLLDVHTYQCYSTLKNEHFWSQVTHSTAKKITETTELFFSFIFFCFFWFAHFPSRFEVFRLQKYLVSCVRVANEISRIYFSYFILKILCSIRTSLLTLLAGVKSWNEIVSRNVSEWASTLEVLTFGLRYLASLCLVLFRFVCLLFSLCVANYCIYSFDSVILFNCFFFSSLFTW